MEPVNISINGNPLGIDLTVVIINLQLTYVAFTADMSCGPDCKVRAFLAARYAG